MITDPAVGGTLQGDGEEGGRFHVVATPRVETWLRQVPILNHTVDVL